MAASSSSSEPTASLLERGFARSDTAADDAEEARIKATATDPKALSDDRMRSLDYWIKRTQELTPACLKLNKGHPDPYIRRLLLKNKMDIPDVKREFGDLVHILCLTEKPQQPDARTRRTGINFGMGCRSSAPSNDRGDGNPSTISRNCRSRI